MKKTTFFIVIASIILLPVTSYAMTLKDVLTQYYVEISAPKVLGATTNDGGKTTSSLEKPKLSVEAGLNIIKALRYSEGSAAIVSEQLKKGNNSDEVKKLQLFLIAKGYLNADPTGFYGSLTTKAVKEFQAKNGIIHTGALVGPSTRAAI